MALSSNYLNAGSLVLMYCRTQSETYQRAASEAVPSGTIVSRSGGNVVAYVRGGAAPIGVLLADIPAAAGNAACEIVVAGTVRADQLSIFDGTPLSSVEYDLLRSTRIVPNQALELRPVPDEVIDGEALLLSSLFWSSTLDATSPDREATRNAVTDYQTVVNGTLTQTGTKQDGTSGALRFVPAAGTYVDASIAGRIDAKPVNGFTEGVKSTVVLKWKPDAELVASGATPYSYLWLNGTVIAETDNRQTEAGQQTGLRGSYYQAFPYRAEASKSGEYWQELLIEYSHTNAGNVKVQPFINQPVTTDGVDGLTIDDFHWYQSPLAALPNRASGGAVASVASESAAPLLERPLAPDQSQHRGAWIDGTRCLRFLGVVGEYVDISGASALNGADHDWAISFAWFPVAHPAANADVLVVSGTTARLKLTHLSTGYLQVTRTADDGTSVTATCSRKVGTVAHVLTVQCIGGSVTFWSHGVQWGTAQALTSGKVATFASARLGASTWQGSIAECAIAAKGFTGAEVAAQHAALCVRRSLPVGAREAWLMNGQSNVVPVVSYGSRGYRVLGADATRLLRNCRGMHFESSPGASIYAGWGPARYFAVDRRTSQGLIGTTSNFFMGQEVTLHQARRGITTIRYAVGAQPVSAFAPGGAYHAAMRAAFDLAVEEAGVPLNIRGMLYVNGEAEVTSAAGVWSASMSSLHAYLAGRYGSGGAFYSIHRRLPTAYAHGAQTAGVAQVQSEMDAWAAASPTTRAGIDMEDMTDDAEHWEDFPTNVHGGTPHRWAEGTRFAAAIAALGL